MASAWMSDVSEGATPGLAVLAEPEARDNARLARALLVSLLAHGVLLSLTFGDAELGLPGLALPWAVRRMEAPDLRVRLVPAQAAPSPPSRRLRTASPGLTLRGQARWRRG